MFSLIFRSALPKCGRFPVIRTMSSSGAPPPPFSTLAVSHPAEFITHVELNRPEKRNAMNKAFWSEMVECFNQISDDPDCRVVLVSGSGKVFTAGIDLMDMASDVLQPPGDDTARISWNMRKVIRRYQETFSAIEKCPKPVVVAVHGACVGGGVDLISACDIRLCSQDAWFQVKEVDIGLAADVGTLQRLPKIIGSLRNILVPNQGLDYMATWNMSMLQTQDVMKSAQASMEKKRPKDHYLL
ncbi:delta(3,5)-Delta(2,4)-dienoyl-CoA isomerase, mitochondrial [Menidia menidia]